MGLSLLKSGIGQSDVEVAWEIYRCLILAEVDDPALQEVPTHQLAISRAKVTYQRLYDEWSRS